MKYYQMMLKGGRPVIRQINSLCCPGWLSVSIFNEMYGLTMKKKIDSCSIIVNLNKVDLHRFISVLLKGKKFRIIFYMFSFKTNKTRI